LECFNFCLAAQIGCICVALALADAAADPSRPKVMLAPAVQIGRAA